MPPDWHVRLAAGSAARLRRPRHLATAVLLAMVALYAATSPWGPTADWSDASQHVMNGALIHDFLAHGHLADPLGFAAAYYLRYPAINITLYPPIFPALEAALFALTGVTPAAAQALELGFTLLAAAAAYRIGRLAMGRAGSLAGAGFLLSMPMVAVWSRQTMLEMPALSLQLAASYFLLTYVARPGMARLAAAASCAVAATYMKQTAIVAAPVFAVLILQAQGLRALRRPALWLTAAACAAALAPLALYTVKFGAYAAQTIGGTAGDEKLSASWWFYLAALPTTAGIPVILASAAFLLRWAARGAAPRAALLGRWAVLSFAVQFAFATLVAHKEARYGVFMVAPLGIVSALAFGALPGAAAALALPAAALSLGATLLAWPPKQVSGYAQAADYIAAHARPGAVILFHGLRSPNFILALRTDHDAARLTVLRAEKLLVRYAIIRQAGITDLHVSAASLVAMVSRYGIEYVVFQPDFWTDQPSVAMLQDYIRGSGNFRRDASIPVHANFPGAEDHIEIWRNLHPAPPAAAELRLDIPAMNRSVSGTIGARP